MIKRPANRYVFSVIRERLQQRGESVLDFAMGGTYHPLAEPLAALVHERPELALRRAGPAEVAAFCEAAAEMLQRVYGASVSPSSILPAPAGRPAMSALVACLLHPGDGVLVTVPGYPAFAEVAAQHQTNVLRAPLDPQRGFAPDLGAIDGSTRVRLASLNYPNNPTGAVLAPAMVGELVARLDGTAVLFNDAAYGPLVYDGSPSSLLGLQADLGLEQPVVELHSLGKLFALGPMGISFLVGSEEVMTALREYSEYAWAPLSSLQLELGLRCVTDDALLGSIREFFGRRVGSLRTALGRLGFRPYSTPGGLYVLSELPAQVGDIAVEDAQQAAELLLERHGLAVVGWDLPPNAYLRFSALYREEDLQAIEALGPLVR